MLGVLQPLGAVDFVVLLDLFQQVQYFGRFEVQPSLFSGIPCHFHRRLPIPVRSSSKRTPTLGWFSSAGGNRVSSSQLLTPVSPQR